MTSPTSPLEATFFAALEKDSPAQRAAYLDQACGNDPALRKQVERMLAAQAKAGSFLELAAEGIDRAAVLSAVAEGPGSTIGRYKLMEEIAEGGMGVVYRAEQQEPVRRTVALKIIKPGMDTREVIARFESERQALAMMDHPNIAKVFDAGETESQRPYFAMELVDGKSLTEYCDQQQLAPTQRLELFIQVCWAVQHAHQKGIIHRDLKPSNVLVALYDGLPVPKIIDFGIAKAVHSQPSAAAITTGLGRMIGTPLYMSPEQAGQGGLDVDTRSDIYSLGVMLYELLTGSTPFDQKRAREADYDEIRRMIREEEPLRPSARISTLGEAAVTVSTCRKTEPAKLGRLLRGDLDWIVMRALDKAPARRYQTAADFARDVERHLAHEPVQAGPPGKWYRTRKFIRRFRAPLAISTGFVALLMAITIIAVRGYYREAKLRADTETANFHAEREAEIAKRNFKMARDAVKEYYTKVAEDPRLKPHDFEKLRRDLLESANEFYEKLIRHDSDDPALQQERVEALIERGRVEGAIGDWPKAEAAYKAAIPAAAWLAKSEKADIDSQSDLADIQIGLFAVYRATNRFKDAEAALRVAIPIEKALVIAHPEAQERRHELARSYLGLGVSYAETGRTTEAAVAYNEAIPIQKTLVKEHPEVPKYQHALADALGNLGIVYEAIGRTTEAEASFNEAIVILKNLAKQDPSEPEHQSDLGAYEDELCILYQIAGRNKEAEAAGNEALAVQKTLIDSHPDVPEYHDRFAGTYLNLGMLYRHTARPEDAEAAEQKAVSVLKTLVEKYPAVPRYRSQLSKSLGDLGLIYLDSGRVKEAQAAYNEGLAIQKALADTNPDIADYQIDLAAFHSNLGMVYQKFGRFKDAEAAYLNALGILKTQVERHPNVTGYACELGHIHDSLGTLYKDAGRAKEAEAAGNESLTILKPLAEKYPRERQIRVRLRSAYYDLACAYAKPLAKKNGLASGDADLSTAPSATLVANAFECLQQACDLGYFDTPETVEGVKSDDDLGGLRGQPKFSKLLERIAKRPKRGDNSE